MGNIISSEERHLRHSSEELRSKRKVHRILWTDREFGYHSKDNPSGRGSDPKHKTKKRTVSFYTRNEKGEALKSKSQSLDAIIEELYLAGSEDRRHIEKEEPNQIFGNRRTFIPRIKLTRSTSSLKVEKRYKPILKMSVKSEILDVPDLGKSLGNIYLKSEGQTDYDTIDVDDSSLYSKSDENSGEIRAKPDENYFAKNFDECMKRLQLIEREHEKIEKDESEPRLFPLRKNSDKREMESAEVEKIRKEIPLFDLRSEDSDVGNPGGKGVRQTNESVRIKVEVENQTKSTEDMVGNPNNTVTFKTSEDGITTEPGIMENDDLNGRANQELISTWYSNLKQQFEKSEKEEHKNKEMSCRITGATLKNSHETVKQEEKDINTRHYFSRLVKSNKSLIDEELPDPDKVKNIRAMFQENLNSTLKKRLNQKLGGSLQNICSKTSDQQMTRPLSAQCNRDEVLAEIREDHSKLNEGKISGTETMAESLKDSDKDFQSEISKRKLFEKYDKDLKMGREFRAKKFLQPKWTDTGSVSSGVSSDLSSYDTDLESYSREGVEPEQDEITISDEDVLEEVQDKHYVQNEILEKIRSFGTSVTYYGGEMVTCSVGPLLSPTTQAIMEEIGEKYGHETRSFHEFYKKYVETNEPTRKKKLGRTRSFGQYDVFQKPNVLNNTEIEMYKNDLEAEIGLRKPTGMSPNGLKMKLSKSNSVGSPVESTEKSIPVIIEPVTEDETPREENISISDENNLKEVSNERVMCETNSEGNVTENLSQIETCEAKQPSESEKEINSKNQSQERKKKEDTESSQSAIVRKEYLIERSQSAPEGLLTGNISNNIKPSELPSKEILFGYEKSLFNCQRKQDMEFEEFEVCETVSEKLEKLDEKNSSEYQSTTKSNEDFNKVEANDITKEELSEKPETPTDKVLKLETTPKRKWNINLNEEKANEPNNNSHTNTTTNGPVENSFEGSKNNSEPVTGTTERKVNGQTHKKFTKNNQSRWPIETSVMVDIQKNNEQTPKIVTNGKTFAKTKIRLF